MSTGRNTVPGFVQRTRTNLELIRKSYESESEGHVVTQLANSLLGIIVFPWEHQGLNAVKKKPMSSLGLDGWPERIVGLQQDCSIGQFVRKIRNAVAHGRVAFSSDNRDLDRVSFVFEDARNGVVTWRASFDGRQLWDFCTKLMYLIEK